jgi:DNA (cytosine-5)-methyltransferase 3A
MLENVRMKKEYQDVISGYFGVQPIPINSSLVSAQNRYRLYWTNIPNVTQPDDRGILLRDIILDDVDNKYYYSNTVMKRLDVSDINHVGMVGYKSKGKEVDKCGTLLARHYKGMQSLPYPIVKVTGARQTGRYLVDGKRADHTVDSMKGLTEQRIEFREDGKSNCLTSVQKDSLVGIDNYICRKLTPIECERLQTFPDNWTEGISDTQRYKALGNSWTVDVVAHIFKNL